MRLFALAAIISIASGAASAADPHLLNLVMPDARVVAGVNVASAEASPLGQFLMSRMTGAMGPQLAGIPFDFRRDITEFIAAAPAPAAAGAPKSGLIAAMGNFPVDQLTAALTGNNAGKNGATIQNYAGATMITESGGNAVAFLGNTVAIAGDLASVKAALDRSGAVNALAPDLAAQVQTLGTANDFWAVSLSPISSMVPGLSSGGAANGPGGQILQMLNSIQASTVAVKFGVNIDLAVQLTANDPSNAKALADVLQAMATLFAMSGGGNNNPQAAQLLQILQQLKVSANGPAVNIALSVPETQIETIINSQTKAAVKPAALRK